MTTDYECYDYVIVGAGSAGCVLASRLSEDPNVSVLLLEAGHWDRSRWIHLPIGLGRILQRRLFDWGYASEPQNNLNGRQLPCLRGKVLGGTSSINSMTYVRGNRGDYDRWAANGLSEWSYEKVLPYFKKLESWEGGASEFRGADGPVRVQKSRYSDPLVDAYLAAATEHGYPINVDYNGASQEGFSLIQSMIRNGRRVSAATAYLRPALSRRNLKLRVLAQATRVVFEGQRAIGIEYVSDGKTGAVRAQREIILSGGAINSPQLLLLSGIGPADELAQLSIPVKHDSPGVGRNLQDHIAAGISYQREGVGPVVRNLRLDRIAIAMLQANLFGTGFAAELPSRWTAFVKTRPDLERPDIQLQFRAGPLDARPYLPPFRKAFDDGFTCRAVVLRPRSRGTVTLASSNPLHSAKIQFNAMSDPKDWAALRAGLRIVRKLGQTSAVRPFVQQELVPGAGRISDADLDEHIRSTATGADHPLGTCRMGPDSDPLAVVDAKLRVRGVKDLRVVDASVMPDLTRGNIVAPIYMIAERAAELIAAEASPTANLSKSQADRQEMVAP
jgi:4-pyridoxate dehydrogenase